MSMTEEEMKEGIKRLRTLNMTQPHLIEMIEVLERSNAKMHQQIAELQRRLYIAELRRDADAFVWGEYASEKAFFISKGRHLNSSQSVPTLEEAKRLPSKKSLSF